ncbi:MAG TPA: hypothetical protein VMA73_08015 [Streptosporangiaceae bacterium]|nr:hypothetical protein [Streptosporangiaceae bacterium]
MPDNSAGPPAPRLASIRSRWLAAATASIRADPAVLGAALVGSLGVAAPMTGVTSTCSSSWTTLPSTSTRHRVAPQASPVR